MVTEKIAPAVVLLPGALSELCVDNFASTGIRYTEQQNYTIAAQNLFSKVFDSVMWENRSEYIAYHELMKEVKNTAIESIATVDGIDRLYQLAFGNATLRDTLQTLQVRFCTLQCDFNTKWENLIASIALSVTQSSLVAGLAESDKVMLPEEIIARQHDFAFLKGFMLTNTWFTILVLVILWGKLYTYEELRVKYNEKFVK